MTISVPATSANLGPGFDSLGLAVDLRNIVDFHHSRFFSVSIKGEGENNPRLKGNNLFISIFNEHYGRLTKKRQNFKFTFYNKIPMSRGLGSSSAVIVSAIASAHEAAGIKVSKRRILNHALVYEPHPDNITPAVMGGFNVACIEGDRIYSKKHRLPSFLMTVLVVPDRTISTARSRNVLPKTYTKEEMVYSLSRAAYMTALFMSESWEQLKIASKDKIHQDRRMKVMPELFDVQKLALEKGAFMSTLSGSGSTFFNLCHKDDVVALSESLKKRFPHFRVISSYLDNYGVIGKH